LMQISSCSVDKRKDYFGLTKSCQVVRENPWGGPVRTGSEIIPVEPDLDNASGGRNMNDDPFSQMRRKGFAFW
jgi:hypothetical protein